ncbi:hypothetical protein BD779DRAFT_1434247 [Infundibulicybe gibba]|nr:hypothetical protein BD779DRAFT_1434247 [Infundibulicybe gibba]
MNIIHLPTDVLILIFYHLSATELAVLSSCCRAFTDMVTELGWSCYLRANRRPSSSLSQSIALWSPKERVRYEFMADRSWSRSEFVARPLSRPWQGRVQPLLAINTKRLIIAAGSNIHSYTFGHSENGGSPPVKLEGVFPLVGNHGQKRNITSITFIDDHGSNDTLYMAYQDGDVERIQLRPIGPAESPSLTGSISEDISLTGDFVESLSSAGNTLLSLSSNGRASVINTSTPSLVAGSIDLQCRGWASHLTTHSSGPYAAFGTSSKTPLTVHAITSDRLSQSPFAVLTTSCTDDTLSSSAVYGIARAPLSSPWGASPQIIVSGWFDGQARCYDLRSSSRVHALSPRGPAPLRPVLTLSDPRSYESIYSISCGGGFSSHIAAGTARHSVISIWDVRSPNTGWSVYAPGNDPSPVYSLVLESSRLFAATQSRPFVYDFGPYVNHNTYPLLPDGLIDGLKRKKKHAGLPGYYVTKYKHAHSSTSNHY